MTRQMYAQGHQTLASNNSNPSSLRSQESSRAGSHNYTPKLVGLPFSCQPFACYACALIPRRPLPCHAGHLPAPSIAPIAAFAPPPPLSSVSAPPRNQLLFRLFINRRRLFTDSFHRLPPPKCPPTLYVAVIASKPSKTLQRGSFGPRDVAS